MKNLIVLFFFLTVFNLYCQEEVLNNKGQVVILNPDRTWIIKGETFLNPCHSCKSFTALNGRDEPVLVKLNNANISEEDITNENLEKAIREALLKAKYSLKNKISFIPQEVGLVKTEEGLSVVVFMIGTNSYGAEGEETVFFMFNENGEIIKSF